MTAQTWLMTGASSGLGRALAEHVLREGDNAVLTAPSIDALRALAAPYPGQATGTHSGWGLVGSI